MRLFLRSLFWTVLCPGMVVLVVPAYFLIDIKEIQWPSNWQQWIGLVFFMVGGHILLRCIFSFAIDGKGTLSPIDPARRLVVKGLYKYVRNPMYVGVVCMLLGETVYFWQLPLLGYTALVFLIFNLFIRLYEEPHLRQQFGAEYAEYCSNVRGGFPGVNIRHTKYDI